MMSGVWVRGAVLLGIVLLSFAALFGAALVWELPQHLPSITVNGLELEFGEAHAGHWVVASAVVLIVVLVLLVVVPVALLLGVALPVSTALAVAAALLSPVLLGWWLWRSTRAKPPAGATMPS